MVAHASKCGHAISWNQVVSSTKLKVVAPNSISDPFSTPRCLFVTMAIEKFKMILDEISLITKQNPLHWSRDNIVNAQYCAL